jgi:uncharacterized protein YerC
MSKSVKKLNPHEKKIVLESLYACAGNMKSEHSAVTFIDELLTESEKITIGRRILIAQMILAGEPQTEIRFRLGVSPNTFTRTRKWLTKQIPHYDQALKDFEQTKTERKTKQKKISKEYVDPLSFTALRKKFPAHFLFFNLAEELLTSIRK